MPDSLEQFLHDLTFDVPPGLSERARRAAATQTGGISMAPRRRPRDPADSVRSNRAFAVVAAILAIAIVIALVLVGQRLNHLGEVPAGLGPVASSAPIPVKPPTDFSCSDSKPGCAISDPVFLSSGIAWIAVSSLATGDTNLYRSEDGGRTWRAVMSWNNPALSTTTLPDPYVVQIKSSPDGMDALVVTGWGDSGAALLHTTDGGTRWTSNGVPAAAGPYEPLCPNVACNSGEVYFLNPHEGWIASATGSTESTLFHTSDSGAHWSAVGRFDARTNLDPLKASYVFTTSDDGWLVPPPSDNPPVSRTVFKTKDGGATWQPETLGEPNALPAYSGLGQAYSTAGLVSVDFFDSGHGLVVMEGMISTHCQNTSATKETCWADGKLPFANDPSWTYVYTTNDGGRTWSKPISVPTADFAGSVDFIDTTHWIAFANSSTNLDVMRTDDAGKTWHRAAVFISGVPSGAARIILDAPGFTDPTHGWARINCSEWFATTSDGGATWQVIAPPNAKPIHGGWCP